MLNQLNQYILQGNNPFKINTIQNEIQNKKTTSTILETLKNIKGVFLC